MFATVAAGTAVMTTELPASPAADKAKGAFLSALGFLLGVLRDVFLPHMLWGVLVFMTAGLTVFAASSAPLKEWPVLLGAWGLFLLAFYGAGAFLYAVVTAGVFAMRLACARVEDLLYALFAAVKERVAQKIDDMDEGLAKDQAKVLMKNSVSEVAALLKTYRLRSIPAAAGAVFLALLSFTAKSVFLARLAQMSGATVSMSALFASRATLVGAIFLNLRFICTAFLWVLYLLGAGILAGSLLIVFAAK